MRRTTIRAALLLACALLPALLSQSASAAAAVGAKAPHGVAGVQHVLVISIDGLRPDLALRASMPNLRALLSKGAYSFWAKTTALSVTLPSHTSMVTGVSPAKHGIVWNSDLPFSETVYPTYPTVMELATRAGWVTAMVAGKSKFATLNKPGTITHVFVPPPPNSSVDDDIVADHATGIIREFKPALLFVHFPGVDHWGHEQGWGSPQQIGAIERVDLQLGRILAAIDQAGLAPTTAIIVSADHGGAGRTHGPDDARSRHIPWILVGPGVRKGFDLTQFEDLEIRTEDTAATVCYLLGLAQSKAFDGKPVLAAVE